MFDILSNFTEFGTSLALRNGSEYRSYEEAPKDFLRKKKKNFSEIETFHTLRPTVHKGINWSTVIPHLKEWGKHFSN